MGNKTHVDTCNCNSCQTQHKNAELWETVGKLREQVKSLIEELHALEMTNLQLVGDYEESDDMAGRLEDQLKKKEAENVGLSRSLRSVQIQLFNKNADIRSVIEKIDTTLSSSSSAKWVEDVMETLKLAKNYIDYHGDATFELTEGIKKALEKEGNK